MATHTVDLPCIADTYIDQNYPSTNYGSASTLIVGEDGTGEYYMRQYALLRFDISSVARKKILSAHLEVYVNEVQKGLDGLVMTRTLPNDFEEYSATFENTSNSIPGKTGKSRSMSNILTGQYQEFNALYANYFYPVCVVSVWDSPGYYAYIRFASREGANPPMLRVTYEDIPPNAPTPTEPIGAYKDSKSIIRFGWTYSSDVGGEQKAFDLQWSIDQSTWTTVSETTANNYYDMPADTFPVGNIYWRVRTYNEYDEVGPYCAIQSFYAIGAPTTPVLNAVPTDTARPTISWSAFSQQVYQLQVLSGDDVVYDSGTMPGINVRQHKVKAWLADGSYTVKLRIKNEYDMWSDWGSAAVTISTVKPEKPTLTIQRSAHGVEINATGLIYRSDYNKDDYICIGTAAGTFYDNAVVSGGEYKYFVRAISENDTYNDSDIKFIQADFRHALIAPVSDLNNVFAFTSSLNSPPKRTYNHQPGGAFVEYAGRKYPVWEPTEHVSAGISMAFFLMTWADVERFIEIYDLKGTVLYRDAKGRKIYGTLSNLSVTDDWSGYTVSFVINQVDYNEGLEV